MGLFTRTSDDGKVLASPEYWANRAEWVESTVMRDVAKVDKALNIGYTRILKDVEKDIADFMVKNQSIEHIMRPVTIRGYLEEMSNAHTFYNKVKNDPNMDDITKLRAKRRLKAMNASIKKTRLDVLHDHIQTKLDVHGVKMQQTVPNLLKSVFTDTYNRKQYTINRGVGYGYQYGAPNFKAIDKALTYPWAKDGSMFSDRIWNYVDHDAKNFTEAVRQTVASGILARGKHPSTVAKEIMGFGNPTLSKSTLRFNSTRLLYTESSHMLASASAEVSDEWGLTDYKYLATLDDRTSNICQELDGRPFKHKERQTGVNFPPMHPNCRSTTVDIVPDSVVGYRASRDINGETVHEIPSNVNYKDWKHWQNTGEKRWVKTPPPVVAPKKAPSPKKPKAPTVETAVDRIVKVHKNISMYKGELVKELKLIVEQWDVGLQTVYEKMLPHVEKNKYSKKSTKTVGAHYAPYDKRVNMHIKENNWENAYTFNNTTVGAWNTKFHEEFHQIDHLLGDTDFANDVRGNRPYRSSKFTDPSSIRGGKMLKAINEDVLTFMNEILDRENQALVGTGRYMPTLTDVSQIDGVYSQKFIAELSKRYQSRHERASIGAFTDAVGLTTLNNVPLQNHGFWGHRASYNMQRGQAGATSETWATYGAIISNPDPFYRGAVQKLMPRTMAVMDDVFEELVEHVKTNDLNY